MAIIGTMAACAWSGSGPTIDGQKQRAFRTEGPL
jgi:hypothetical protein